MLRSVIYINRMPPLWHGVLAIVLTSVVDMVVGHSGLMECGILLLLLGGFYTGPALRHLSMSAIAVLVVSSFVHEEWGAAAILLRIVTILAVGIIAYRGAAASALTKQLAEPKGQGQDEKRSKDSAQQDSSVSSSRLTGPIVPFDSGKSFADGSGGLSGDKTNVLPTPNRSRTSILVRLVDTDVFTRAQAEIIASMLHDAPDQENGLIRCVQHGYLTGLQAEWFGRRKERSLRIGKYTLLSELGRGGMGTVYRAFDRERNEIIALKLFRDSWQDLLFIRREMMVLQELAHPNLVTSYDVGDADGQHFIAMEHIDGTNLAEIVSRSGRMAEGDALDATIQVAHALQHMHDRGVVHRDIKPSNVMRAKSGLYKLMDVGICRPSDELCEFNSRELNHEIIYGTVGFAAPEQVDLPGRSDVRSDIYSLGGMLFYLLTGRCYVQGENTKERLFNLLFEKKYRDAADYDVRSEVVETLTSMLHHEPNERLQTIESVIGRLRALQSDAEPSQDDCRVSVLVVEDNPTDLAVAKRLLARSNRSVDILHSETFSDALVAVEEHLASVSRPLIVLLDLSLPDSLPDRTIETLATLAADYVGVIAMTGDDSPAVRHKCLNSGADEFLSKNQIDSRSLERAVFTTASRLSRRQIGLPGQSA